MLHINTENPSNSYTNTSSKPPLFAFKPRQVLLAEHNRRSNMAASALKAENGSKVTSLTPEMKGILHQSLLHYLHRNGFSKTLKRFQSEAQIQSGTWEASSLHLEDLFCKYNASNADTNFNTSKKPELENDEAIKKDNMCSTNEEITTKKKKKKGTVESDSGAIEDHSKVTDKKMVESGKDCGQISKDIIAKELETEPKKKKAKHDLDSPGQAQEAKSDVLKKTVDETTNGLEVDDSTKKTKDKKRKGTVESDSGAIEGQSKVTNKKMVESSGKNCGQISEDIIVNEPETKPKKKKTKHDLDSPGQAEEAKLGVLKKPVDDAINGLEMDGSTKKTKDKKKKSIQLDKLEPSTTSENEFVTDVSHKERKKKKKKSSIDSAVEDGQVNPLRTDAENEGVQPDFSKKEKKSSKKRKRSLPEENDHISTEITSTEESKRQKTETSIEEKSKKEGSKVNDMIAQETSNKQLDGQANGKLEINGGEKSGAQKSTKKLHNGSAEPKTVNAFQRVKIDQVEFAHERLQDNSYWAKDGAEIGYGAKAQEVLGQVRGRGFRHEKTKKKRGSYRGGLIDLQSHSVKFNYSDEE